MRKFLITTEAVCEGHADKIADQIADAILDEILKQDKHGRSAIEVMVGSEFIVLSGEINTFAWIDYNKLVRRVIKEIGYDKEEYGFFYKTIAIINAFNKQSPDVAQAIGRTASRRQGAGDQGFCTGYATNETEELMPLPVMLAQKMARQLADVRKKNILPYLRPDGKCQISVEYRNGIAARLENVVVAAQHNPGITQTQIKQDIIEYVIKPTVKNYLDDATRIFVNSAGRFVIGGPSSDTGMTGHKTIIDSYGATIPSSGSGFSGKDPTKIARSGAYLARYIAKNIVAAKLADKCFVRLAYVIGKVHPIEASIETFNTQKVNEELIERAIPQVFDLSAGGIIRQLKLLRPIYRKTSCYGHFGRNETEFTWERKDKVPALLKAVEKNIINNQKRREKKHLKI